MPLHDADALRTTDPAAALAAYVSHRDELDPLDAERMGWIAQQRGGAMTALLGHLKQAAEFGERDLAIACALAVAGTTQDTGELDTSEHYYALVMDMTRDDDRETYLRACVNLAQTFRSGGRVFECLVLARMAERETADNPHFQAAARLQVCGAMASLHDIEGLAEAIVALRASVEAMDPGPQRDVLYALTVGFRWEVDRARGDHVDALATLDDFEKAVPIAPHTEHFVIESWVHRAGNLIALGRLDEAAKQVQRARRSGLDRPDFLVMLEAVEVQLLARVEGTDQAMPWALAFLDTLESTSTPGHGAIVSFATELGKLFVEELHDVEAARRCFDLAVHAANARVAELDRARVDIPEMAVPDERDTATLAAARERSAALLEDAARRLETTDPATAAG